MKKIILLLGLFISFHTITNAQPIRWTECSTIDLQSNWISFGCGYLPTSGIIDICFDCMDIMSEKDPNIRLFSKCTVYQSGDVEYNGEVINFESQSHPIIIYPNERKTIQVNRLINNELANVKLEVNIWVSVYDIDMAPIVDIDKWELVLQCFED